MAIGNFAPKGVLALNRSHHLMNGLLGVIAYTGSNYVDLLTGAGLISVTDISAGLDLNAPALVPSTSTNVGFRDLSAAEIAAAPQKLTLLTWFRINAVADTSFYNIAGYGSGRNSTNFNGCSLTIFASGGLGNFAGDGNGSGAENRRSGGSSSALDVGELHCALARFTAGAAGVIYVNGLNVATGASGTASSIGYTGGKFGIVTRTNTDSETMHHESYVVAAWNRHLSDSEIWKLFDTQTRWDFIQPSAQILQFPVPAVGVTLPIIAGGGGIAGDGGIAGIGGVAS